MRWRPSGYDSHGRIASGRGWPCLVAEGRGLPDAARGSAARTHLIAKANSCEAPWGFMDPPPQPLKLLGASVWNPMSGQGSVSGWVGVRGRQVGCEGDCGKYREGWRVVDTFHTQLAQRYTVKHWAFRASVGIAGAGTGVAEAGPDVVVDEVVPLRRRVSVHWPG